MDFTEEQAKDKLEELGFEVRSVDDYERVGFGIIKVDDEHWAVCEMHRLKGGDGSLTRMNLSGWLPDHWACVGWLRAYLADRENGPLWAI